MKREESLRRVRDRQHQYQQTPWDIVVIGGGATGVAIALDAASRGLEVLLVERADFGKGTSSRSTKLIHGGVRYLQQGNVTLVRDALRERALLRGNAPLLVHDLPFFIPCTSRWQRFYFGTGLKLYDLLAGRSGFGRSRGVSAGQATARLPTLLPEAHRGGVIYHDGQFDDCRLLIHMARTAAAQGACLLNYTEATGLEKDSQGRATGVLLRDGETGQTFRCQTRCVINAGGPFSDAINRLDDPQSPPRLAASQGAHLVLPREFFPGQTALIVPRTSDGRVLFLIPWRNHVVVGTTDTPIPAAVEEPTAQRQELEFLLHTAAQYLTRAPLPTDVTSVFTGVRPLVQGDPSARTASLSRDHEITVSASSVVTIRGGKWTTVRKMAEDCLDRAIQTAGLTAGPCRTAQLPLHAPLSDSAPRTPAPRDAAAAASSEAAAESLSEKGSDPLRRGKKHYQNDSPPKGQTPFRIGSEFLSPDATALEHLVQAEPELGRPLPGLPELRGVDVAWAARQEMARTVEDVLARRSRWLFLDVRRARAVAPEVARRLAEELGRDHVWQQQQLSDFNEVADHYDLQRILSPSTR